MSTQAVLADKQIIFTVSTGRSGTAFLEWILGFHPKIDARHEPEPSYHHCLRDIQGNREGAKKFLLDHKFPEIEKSSKKIYFESSHLFCKGFAEACLELGVVPDLIIHKRENRKVALSMVKGNTVPTLDEKGDQFYLRPDDPEVVAPKEWLAWTPYQICYWYTLEIDRRAKIYADMFSKRGARIAYSTLDELKTASGYQKLFQDLKLPRIGLSTWYKFFRHRNFKMNAQLDKPCRHELPLDLENEERQVELAMHSFS